MEQYVADGHIAYDWTIDSVHSTSTIGDPSLFDFRLLLPAH